MGREKVAEISDIPKGSTLSCNLNGKKIAVCNVHGSFYAIEDVCTHDGAPLDQGILQGHIITCPRHGATFDVTTGAALSMPAVVPVKTIPLEIESEGIYVQTDEG